MEQNWFDYTYQLISIISAIATIYLLYKILSYRVQKRRLVSDLFKKLIFGKLRFDTYLRLLNSCLILYHRALEKVRKKSLIIKGIQSKLEEKLEKLKHSSTWDDILKTSFDVSISLCVSLGRSYN